MGKSVQITEMADIIFFRESPVITRYVVVISRSVMSDSAPHGLQHTRLPCPHYLPEFAKTHVH